MILSMCSVVRKRSIPFNSSNRSLSREFTFEQVQVRFSSFVSLTKHRFAEIHSIETRQGSSEIDLSTNKEIFPVEKTTDHAATISANQSIRCVQNERIFHQMHENDLFVLLQLTRPLFHLGVPRLLEKRSTLLRLIGGENERAERKITVRKLLRFLVDVDSVMKGNIVEGDFESVR